MGFIFLKKAIKYVMNIPVKINGIPRPMLNTDKSSADFAREAPIDV
jgi:hypothetical protein